MKEADVQRAVDGIWRIESAKIIAGLVRMVRDINLAEDLAQDALIAALERWPEKGIPDNPGAWLMTTAKRRAIDHIRRNQVRSRKYEELGREMELQDNPNWDEAADDFVGDDLLRLIFMSCHPVLSSEARVALTLRLLGGLTTEEISRAFFVPEATIAQRIVRAKRTLAAAHVPFDLPQKSELDNRLASVLEVIYLMFNEGYSASSGERWIRPVLCAEALRLGRILAEMVSGESEVHGLVALMEIQSSRFRARVEANGESVLLKDQNRALWDYLLIRRGLEAIKRAERLGKAYGPYMIQASIAACHACAHTVEETDWIRISALYDALSQVAPSPVVELNRAIALSMAFGPKIGLELVEGLMHEPSLKNYYLLPSVRGDLLLKLGCKQEECQEFKRAAELTHNEKERLLLLRRASECNIE